MIQRSLKACVISSCTGNILLNHPLGSIALNLPKLAMLLASLFQFSKASPTSTLDIDQYHIVLVSNSLVSVQMILTSHDDHMIARLLAAQVLYRFQYEFQSILPEILVKLETEANKQSQDYTLSQALQGNSASSSTLLEFQVFQSDVIAKLLKTQPLPVPRPIDLSIPLHTSITVCRTCVVCSFNVQKIYADVACDPNGFAKSKFVWTLVQKYGELINKTRSTTPCYNINIKINTGRVPDSYVSIRPTSLESICAVVFYSVAENYEDYDKMKPDQPLCEALSLFQSIESHRDYIASTLVNKSPLGEKWACCNLDLFSLGLFTTQMDDLDVRQAESTITK